MSVTNLMHEKKFLAYQKAIREFLHELGRDRLTGQADEDYDREVDIFLSAVSVTAGALTGYFCPKGMKNQPAALARQIDFFKKGFHGQAGTELVRVK